MKRYNPKEIEPKWQKTWDETGAYKADLKSDKPKYIAMSMFNYPSGAGIHIGHAMNYTISDVKARFKRQQGYESYHPVGWDAFGLPAENFAIKSGVSPQASMAKIIPDYHKQYKAMGWSNDWSKEISTHLPEYYKWTQWIFSQMHRNGLAYQDARMQWWCTKCQTVLANEQVIDGKCWRHDSADDPFVEKKEVKQWFFKITDYADELLDSIAALDWTESVKLAQKNWIGKSIGAEINFAIEGSEETARVFTTRPDTLFGATFLVLAPEHPLTSQIAKDSQIAEVAEYVKQAQAKTEVERQANKQKTGVFTGAFAINPANGEKIPIWTADYVLMGYGTGAIMAVPAHDERDHEFAQKFSLPIVEVVRPFYELSGKNASRKDVETIERKIVDVIIKNNNDEYLLIVEDDNTHFAGGGLEDSDSNPVEGAKREAIEETGYTDFKSVQPLNMTCYSEGYRIPKNRNAVCDCQFFEATLSSLQQVKNESDEGKHQLKWVKKEEVEKLLTWEHHTAIWKRYIASEICYVGEGQIVNSGMYNGLKSEEVRDKIVADLAKTGSAQEKVNYRMRDWSVSRQRYWGAPIPIVNCPKDGAVLLPDEQLPVLLPELEDFQPSGDGRSALARATEWLKVDCPQCGGEAERETDTLDTYICSSWYMYRYFDSKNENQVFDSEVVKMWEPIDFYNGADHATAHLLYARFIGHFFKRLGLVDQPEPFKQFLFNGKVTAGDGTMFSKSKGNGVDPLEIIEQGYGADALRTYLMFAAPLEIWVRWDPQGVPGAHRFLSRLWNLVQEYLEAGEGEVSEEKQKAVLRPVHQMIFNMTRDIEDSSYNTAIAAAMGALNELYKQKTNGLVRSSTWQSALEGMVACVAPFAPHIADELWQQLGHDTSVQSDTWPDWDDKWRLEDTVTIAVQVNGKLRGEVRVAADSEEAAVAAAAKAHEKVRGYLDGKEIRKTIYISGKLISFVV